jgi:hypothetical protein
MAKKTTDGMELAGARLLPQIRTRVLDEEWKNTFRRWYPYFALERKRSLQCRVLQSWLAGYGRRSRFLVLDW